MKLRLKSLNEYKQLHRLSKNTANPMVPSTRIRIFFENASSFICLGFASTCRKSFQSLKTKPFGNALHSGSFQKRHCPIVMWTGENGAFQNR